MLEKSTMTSLALDKCKTQKKRDENITWSKNINKHFCQIVNYLSKIGTFKIYNWIKTHRKQGGLCKQLSYRFNTQLSVKQMHEWLIKKNLNQLTKNIIKQGSQSQTTLLCLFTFIQAVKMLIGIVYLVKYKCIISKAIKQPTPDEEPKPDIKMHIFSIIDSEKLKQDIHYEIKCAFQMFASEKAMDGRQVSEHPMQTGRVSKANVAFAFQSNKFQDIRKKNEGRKSFYPQQMNGRKSRMPPRNRDKDDTTNIEVHLLQRKLEQQTKKQGQNIDSRQMSRNMDQVRMTFLNNVQSRRFF